MRLTSNEIENIVNLSRSKFGADVKVILFGSRTDDSKYGGDIDLLIIPSDNQDIKNLTLLEVQLLVSLKMAIGDQKIDLLIKRSQNAPDSIYQHAEQKGISLC